MASLWAIGDIHGQIDLLTTLLAALPRASEDETVFLGDAIDRGPDSAAVVARLLAESEAAPERTILLWGNHEDMAAAHFGLPAPSEFDYDPYDWFANGGHETLEAFGFARPACYVVPCPTALAAYFARLRLYHRSALPGLEPYLFVHAGLLPHQEIEDAPGATLLWIRHEFLASLQPAGRIVVFGHTPQRRGHPLVEEDKIGIDTAAAYGGPLTALQLPERRIFQATGSGRVIDYRL